MPDPNATQVAIINAALTRAGCEPIAGWADGSTEARVAEANYADLVADEITRVPWTWAKKTAALDHLDATPQGGKWSDGWQLPGDVLMLRTVEQNGYEVPYDVQGTVVLCGIGADNSLVATYTWDIPEAQWPADFRAAVIMRLEAVFLRALAERAADADARDQAATAALRLAASRDARKRPARAPSRSSWTAVRVG